ncbi:hypothetical protein R3P38DRAFT_2888956, partial [Favolaschia claudopus]
MDSTQDSSTSPGQTPSINLQRLGRDIHISYGNRTERRENGPSVIILFGWMDAPIRLLAKHASSHRLNWPASDIIIVESHPSWIWSTEKTRFDTMRPVVEYLVSSIYSSTEKEGILLHVMSNGGGFQLLTLSRLLFASKLDAVNTGDNIRLATVFDSTPGIGEYSSLLSTVTTGINSAVMRTALTIPVTMLYLGLRLRFTVMAEGNLFTRLRQSLQADNLLPRTHRQAPRVYIYSNTDTMVPASAVEQHIAYMATADPPFDNIEVERFTGSKHILHERKDSARYWNAVRRVWDRSKP